MRFACQFPVSVCSILAVPFYGANLHRKSAIFGSRFQLYVCLFSPQVFINRGNYENKPNTKNKYQRKQYCCPIFLQLLCKVAICLLKYSTKQLILHPFTLRTNLRTTVITYRVQPE